MNVLGISKVPQYAIPRTFFIELHMSKMRRSENGWVCQKCGFIADNYRAYLEHHKTIHSHTQCIYCGRVFSKPCSCSEHEKYCAQNPKCTPSLKMIRRNTTKNEITHNMKNGHKYAETVCRYCGYSSKYEFSLHCHEKYCYKNPNRCIFPGHPDSEENRRKKSIAMHIAALEGRNRGWAATRCGKERKSYPETFFSKIIQTEFLDKDYMYNLAFYTWKLDFAWPKKKRVIEIDGSQHESPTQHESDIRKDAKLIECGWLVLRIKWVDMFHKTSDMINIAKEFIDNGKIIEVDPYIPKQNAKSYYKNGVKYNNTDIIFKRVHNSNYIPISVWNERRNLILSSGVNLHKFGWVDLVCKKIGLSRRVIYHTVQKFDMDVYIRETTK